MITVLEPDFGISYSHAESGSIRRKPANPMRTFCCSTGAGVQASVLRSFMVGREVSCN